MNGRTWFLAGTAVGIALSVAAAAVGTWAVTGCGDDTCDEAHP